MQAFVYILAFLVQWFFRICALFSQFRVYLPFKKGFLFYFNDIQSTFY